MALKQQNHFLKHISATSLTMAAICMPLTLEATNPPKALSRTSALLEYRWNADDNYKKLYYFQSSNKRRSRATYYLVMSSKNRKSQTEKLILNFPKHFDTSIKPYQLALCHVQLGTMRSKTKCKEIVPASFKVEKINKKISINILPNQPIPKNTKKYAIAMKIFNPSKAGMYQINSFTQSSQESPQYRYMGSWNIDIR